MRKPSHANPTTSHRLSCQVFKSHCKFLQMSSWLWATEGGLRLRATGCRQMSTRARRVRLQGCLEISTPPAMPDTPPGRKGTRLVIGISTDSVRNVSGSSPMGSCSRNDGCGNGGERRIFGDASCPVCGFLEAQQFVRPDGRSGHPSSARVWREQSGSLLSSSGRVLGSKTSEFDETVLLDGHLSVALGKARTRYTTGKT